MRHEDLECVDNIHHRDRLVSLPLLHRLGVINVDDVVVAGALVVDLDFLSVSLRHDEWSK
jgi:hypothetical protein